MKKTVIILAALALVGCAKEVSRVETVEVPALPTSRIVTITAGFEQTKTAYDAEGKFSWLEGDKIGVLVSDGETTKQVTFTADAEGAVSTFTGEVEEGFELVGYASYPFNGDSNDFAWDKDNSDEYGWRLWGSIEPGIENPLASTPLWGVQIEGTNSFTFTTACAIVKFTVKNVPLETYYAYLEVPEESEANLNGWYDMTDGVISMDSAIEPWQNRYNWNTPTEINSTMEYYFFLPVGTLPAGTTFSLCDNTWEAFYTATFAKDVEIARNVVTNIAALELEPAPIYTLEDVLGTYDMAVEYYDLTFVDRIGELVIEKSDDAEKGDIMITKFAGIPGKQYGTLDGENHLITFDCDQIFGDNPYYDNTFVDESGIDTRIFPYLALDFYTGTVIDPQFEILEPGKIKALADLCGFRACTEASWLEDSHNGSWPWTICYTSLIATWHVDAPGSTGEDLGDPVDVNPWTE